VVQAERVLYDSGGFDDSSRFVPGFSVIGQDDGAWGGGSRGSTSVVQTGTTAGGSSQALEVTREAYDVGRWFVTGDYTDVASKPKPVVEISWDMKVSDPDPLKDEDSSRGPFFGIETWQSPWTNDDRSAIAGIDAETGDLIAGGAVGEQVALGEWHSYKLSLDYRTDQFSLFVDGQQRGPAQNFLNSGIDDFSSADIVTWSASDNNASLAAEGTAYYDNYKLTAVPTPSASVAGMALFGFSAIGGLYRRRRTQ
jgi:hypothetical protein